MALGLGLYIIPLRMVALPALIDPLGDPAGAASAVMRMGVGLAALSFAVIGQGGFMRRIGLATLGVLAIFVAI